MSEQNENLNLLDGDEADVMLHKLLHLKSFERPDPSRMIKNQQNIMRRVRQTEHRSWGLGHLLEVNIPWLFSEPRYGIALMFVVFAGLQFWGASARKVTQNDRGVYSIDNVATVQVDASLSTNQMIYPELPDNLRMFSTPTGGNDVQFVGFVEDK